MATMPQLLLITFDVCLIKAPRCHIFPGLMSVSAGTCVLVCMRMHLSSCCTGG